MCRKFERFATVPPFPASFFALIGIDNGFPGQIVPVFPFALGEKANVAPGGT
jgi:hypothetical protein